jgi:hypothetical protein
VATGRNSKRVEDVMPQLNITTTIDISDADHALLQSILQCSDEQLPGRLNAFASAAFTEYVEMFLGHAPLAAITEVRERRLVAMILNAYPGGPPNADEVARLFNVTVPAARTLLRSALAKHRIAIRDRLHEALKAVLDGASEPDEDGDPYEVVVLNPVLIELLNDRLAVSPEPKTAIKRSADSMTKYIMEVGSFDYLRGIFP